MKIFHIQDDDIYPNQVIVDGQIVVQGEHREAFFAVSNFEINKGEQVGKLNKLVKESLKNIPHKDFQLFTINVYQYGDEITEKTERSHGTDWENGVFNIQKLIAVYSWEKGVFLYSQFYENGDLRKRVGRNSASFFIENKKPSTDAKALSEYLQFPLESQKVTWELTYAEYENDYSVDAVIECTEADLIAIKALNSKKYEFQVYLNKEDITSWLPEEIKKKFIIEDGYYTPDEELFDTNLLLKPTLSNGYFFIHGNYLYFSCFAM